MATAGGFLLADGNDQRPIHDKRGYGGAARRRQRHDVFAFSAEVFCPDLRARVEKRRLLLGVWIDRGLPRPFPQGTGNTRQCQVVEGGGSADRSRNNVIDVKRRLLPILRQLTILATFSRSLHDLSA
jgi:hypothetical protein